MAKNLLKNKVFALDGYRISADSNAFNLNLTRPDVIAGCLEDEHTLHLKGPTDAEIGWSGGTTTEGELSLLKQFESDSDPRPASLLIGRAEAGQAAILAEVQLFNLTLGGQRAELASFSSTLMPSEAVSHGACLYTAVGYDPTPGAAWVRPITANETGTAVQVGALAAGQELRVHLHVLDPPGTNATAAQLTATIESDVDGSFVAPVVRHTFAAMSDSGSLVWVADGSSTPVTDTYWRVRFDVGAPDPSWAPLVTLSIRSKT